MLLVSVPGIAAIRPAAVVPVLAGEIFTVASNYTLSVLPLFMLMGNLAVASGLSRDLYAAANAWLGHWRGGLASASDRRLRGILGVVGPRRSPRP